MRIQVITNEGFQKAYEVADLKKEVEEGRISLSCLAQVEGSCQWQPLKEQPNVLAELLKPSDSTPLSSAKTVSPAERIPPLIKPSGPKEASQVGVADSPQHSVPFASASSKTFKKRLILALGLVIGFFILKAIFGGHGQTVGDYIQQLRPQLLARMNSPNSDMQQLIERIHGWTITYKEAEITELTAKTIDGSDRAGKNGSNIATIDMVVTCRWKGWLQDNGYTEIEFTFDNQAKSMSAPKSLNSNAAINWDTVDWGSVASGAAATLGTAFIAYEQSQSESQ